jgi:type IV pilus assembly protein PilY1
MNAVQDILAHATSGTAASVLASGQGSGANLVQAAYYPVRQFYNTNIAWTGTLQNLWYYIDPTFQNTSIREDDGGRVLNLTTVSSAKDYITNFYFDTTQQKAAAQLYSSLDIPHLGQTGSLFSTIDFEDIANLWEAGVLLWNRAASTRTIYTPLDTSLTGGTLTLNSALTATTNQFSTSNIAALRPMLNTDDSTASTTVNNQLAANIIQYVSGVDIPTPYTYTGGSTVTVGYRPRRVQIDLNNNGNVTDTSVVVNGITMNETVPNVWKLGDIIDSTPKIASWSELNNYDTKWNDASYASFVSSATYSTRGTVYVGSNDGMLHAFNLGTLQYKWSGQSMPRQVAKLSGTNLGKENWTFIPKNVLPYLQYQADPDYGHIQTVDLTPFLVDASINKPAGCTGDYWKCAKDVTSWSTILIGGMKLGGASKAKDNNCATNTPNGVCAPTVVGGTSLGYSSYYALDVTDEKNPKLLWEFSNPALGFSSSGPAIVKISSRTVSGTTSGDDGSSTNGRWFVVFGSGPTGPIDQASQKFQGSSDQSLKIFVLDLATGALVTTIDSNILNAFAGSLLNSVFDNQPNNVRDYQDQAVYIPYVKKCASTTTYCTAGTWTDGGVLRLLTNVNNLNGVDTSAAGDTALNPGKWSLSTVMSGIGPVTSSVANLLETGSSGKLRLYFATGRYYYRSASGSDDPSTQRNLFGIVEPCFLNGDYTPACSTQRLLSDLSPVDTTTAAGASGVTNANGWYVTLEPSGSYIYDENNNGTTSDDVYRDYNAERDITDPVTDPISGVAYFTTFKPYNDLCSIGGKTFIWALQYDTGGAPTNLLGTALIQVSTGVIQQMNLSNSFTSMFGRRTGAMEGLPPTTQGLNLMTPPLPVQKVLHERER